MTKAELEKQLGKLRKRDLDVLRGLVENPSFTEAEVAKLIAMSPHNLRKRLRHAYVVLGVESRCHLYAVYHALLGDCRYCFSSD